MQFTLQTYAALAAVAQLVPQVAAHGYVTGIVTGGKWYDNWVLADYYNAENGLAVNKPGWSDTALDSGFVPPQNYSEPDIICHRGGAPGKTFVPVVAGATMQLFWNTWPVGHKGPVLDYIAPCASPACAGVDKTTLKFAKIDAVGLASDKTTWGTDTLIANNISWTTTIPAKLAPGNYVLRHEIIALHGGENLDGAQNYPQCINIQVSGSGSETVQGVGAETFYTPTDPGIHVDIYNNLNSYTIPGPAVQAF